MWIKVMSLFLKNIPLMQTQKMNQFVVTWSNYKSNCSFPEQILQLQTFLTKSSPASSILGQRCADTNTPRRDSWTPSLLPNLFSPKMTPSSWLPHELLSQISPFPALAGWRWLHGLSHPALLANPRDKQL